MSIGKPRKNSLNLALQIPKSLPVGGIRSERAMMASYLPKREDGFERQNPADPIEQDRLVNLVLNGFDLDELKSLLLCKADKVNINGWDSQGRTILSALAEQPEERKSGQWKQEPQDVLNFLEFLGVEVNGRNGKGETALMVAARCNNLQMVQLLQERAADVNMTLKGKKAIDFAREKGHQAVVGALSGHP